MFVSVIKRGNVYCTEKQIKRERYYIPLVPQPNPDELVEIHRLYQTLKASPSGDNQFKKRITWFEKIPNTIQDLPADIALVEYVGVFPPRVYHGNVKDHDRNSKYVKTKPDVRKTLKEELKHQSVKNVERKMNQEIKDDFGKQRNEKQLENLKYNLNRDSGSRLGSTNNAADHIICIEEMTKSHEFVKTVKHVQGISHPVITLDTD